MSNDIKWWLHSLGFPSKRAGSLTDDHKRGIVKDVRGRTVFELAEKIKTPAVVMITGTPGEGKDLFCISLALCWHQFKDRNKVPGYLYTPEYQYNNPPKGHIIYAEAFDGITNYQLKNTTSWVHSVIKDNNIILAGVTTMGTLQKAYGTDFMSEISDMSYVIELEKKSTIDFKYL
jgi:hypothetical protein